MIHNKAEITALEWDMKQKPIFFINKTPLLHYAKNQYFAMVKKEKFCEVEMLSHWLDQYFGKDFLKHFKSFNNVGSCCCMGNKIGEIFFVPKQKADDILLTKEPI